MYVLGKAFSGSTFELCPGLWEGRLTGKWAWVENPLGGNKVGIFKELLIKWGQLGHSMRVKESVIRWSQRAINMSLVVCEEICIFSL